MTDGIPQVVLGIDAASQSVVIVEGKTEVGSLAALVAAAPGLLHPDAAATMARAVAHFAAGSDYRVIDDPAAYEAAYRAKVAAEDPDAPWRAGVLRLRDHGQPDFTGIEAPAYRGTVLVFYAAAAPLPLPYRVEIDVGDAAVTATPDLFQAVTLDPFEPAVTQPAADPLFVGDVGELVRPVEGEEESWREKPARVVRDTDDTTDP